MGIEDRYSVQPMLGVGTLWIVAIIAMIATLSSGDPNFLNFGPGKTTFLQFRVDTWGKWGLVMAYSFFSQLVNSLMNATIYPFITNVIRDHKAAWDGSELFGQLVAVVYKLYYWINDICDVFLVLTLQLQYWIPGLIADVGVSLWTTHYYLRDKPIIDAYDIV